MLEVILNSINQLPGWGTVIQIVEYVSVSMTVLIVLELVFDFITKRRKKFWEPAANISLYFVTTLFERGVYGLILFFLLIYISTFSFLEIPVNLLSWIFCFIATDFLYYVMHRSEHKIRLLWTIHSVHHSSEEYDLTTSLRLFLWVDILMWIFFAPLVLIGFDAAQVVACMVVVFTYMTWIHTEKIGKLGWFDKMFSSPSNHRVHHGRNEQYIDKNFGGVLIIWDRIFGTYEPEVEKVKYGITVPIKTSNPIKVNFHELVLLTKDLISSKNWKLWIKYCFYPPGWKPEINKEVNN